MAQDVDLENPQELDEEELKSLIRDILKNPDKYPEESKLILRLTEDIRPGDSFSRYNRFEILYGDVEKIELSRIEDYPYTDATEYALIPRTNVAVLMEESYDETRNPPEEHKTLHVFTSKKGWAKLKLY